jgi:hypothetical protein
MGGGCPKANCLTIWLSQSGQGPEGQSPGRTEYESLSWKGCISPWLRILVLMEGTV